MKTSAAFSYGFNLIELMITIAIAMILMFVAVPGYQVIMSKERFSNATNNLYNAYRYARSEAIKSAAPMRLVPIDSSWAKGWQVLDVNNIVLQQAGAPHSSVTVTGNEIKILGTGALATSASFKITDTSNTRYLCVLSSGQSQLQEGACS